MSSLPPRPPPGYSSIPASPAAILLPLTISNKCGQSFRWRTVKVARADESYDAAGQHLAVKREEQEQEEPAVPLIVKAEDPDEPPPIVKCEPSNDAADLDTEYSICLADRVVLLRQDVERGYLYHRTLTPTTNHAGPSSLASSTATWLHSYLSLSVPLESLYTEWAARDPVFARTAPRFQGIRMLRQDPWETLCAFICSSNNNIARIGGMVQNLCSHYSPKLLSYSYKSAEQGEDAEMVIDYHPFPSPAALAGPGVEAHLRQIGFGYRAKYIAETARMLCEEHGGVEVNDALYDSVAAALHEAAVKEDKSPPHPPPSLSPAYTHLLSLRSLTYSEARTALLPYQGVGPKVADCILLMSLDQPASIPVDRHVFQFAAKWYGKRKNARYEELAEFFRGVWGEWAGWAHSVLFMADLRAFQDYGGVKKEEEVKEGKDALVAVKEEEVMTAVLAEGTERAAKRTATTVMAASTPTKRAKSSRVDETFHGVKVSRRRVTTTTKGSRASSVENHGGGALQTGE